MVSDKNLVPDYLFETSWEVCNKVGGIYTVISTKALTLVNQLKDNYILIGPDVWMETRKNPEFIEDKYIYRSWREKAESEGHRFKIGRWNIAGQPVVILVDFTPFYAIKDKIFAEFWELYGLDSISGQWDYTEPAIFGYAAARIIASFYDFNISSHDHIVAQFHEWMTGTGVLYLRKHVPQVGLAFTTHATALGRSIAGSAMPLYRDMEKYEPEVLAHQLNIVAKYSLEKISARECDSFTTVSPLTDRECKHFLGRAVDEITPNGFEDSFVPADDLFPGKRQEAKEKLFAVADAVTGTEIPRDSLLLINSGRYEFFNKGIELYIDALGRVNREENFEKKILAYIMVPAGQAGFYPHIKDRLEHPGQGINPTGEYLTHALHHRDSDPVLRQILDKGLMNRPEDKVKIIFVPCYLDGADGIFDMPYYDLLIGFDLSIFPSYYEPWGYTPLESMAFHIPTITTTLAGFGVWVLSQYPDGHGCVAVLTRNEDNYEEVAKNIAEHIKTCSRISPDDKEVIRHKAWEVSRTALWQNLIVHYMKAYAFALEKVELRSELFRGKVQHDTISKLTRIIHAKPEWKKVLIKTSVPAKLHALRKLSLNLWWSWNMEAQELFSTANPALWEKLNHNPYAMLERLTLQDYRELESNQKFLDQMKHVEDKFDEYMSRVPEPQADPVAYFSMEFGLHDSLKIFGGGLGILAGDYLKEASDSCRNIVGVGLLYRYGYFQQSISLLGDQISGTVPQKFSLLPLIPVRGDKTDGNGDHLWTKVKIAFPGRTVFAKVWRVDVGRVKLFLLDTDLEENSNEDRAITSQLYGGDIDMRFRQEVLLGVGGIRLLDTLGIKPSLYHCNEGHAAFIGLERLRKLVENEKLTFRQAIEVVRSSSLFTTHTPVPAGHDAFTEDTLRTYIPHYPSRLGISWEQFLNLGRLKEDDATEKFSMSVIAARLSQEMNGVSRIHGRVTQEMFKDLYPGYFPEESHISYVTNGVHFPTWISAPMKKLYDDHLDPAYYSEQNNASHWQKIYDVDIKYLWKIRQQLRSELIRVVKERLTKEMTIRQESPRNVFKVTGNLSDKALTIGFARRFATYKRSHLLFLNIERLSRIVNDKKRPVQFIYAGKAHPNDAAGQDLIKKIYEISKRPEFMGRIIFLENYDMDLAKKLVSGVDIWLNTPARPQEASGTSGEKAAMNGTINFSVLDGWWAEGYKPGAGWALKEEATYTDPRIQDELDAETMYTMLEEEIIPTFYEHNEKQVPEKWINHVQNTIARIAPYFTMKRQLDDYCKRFYDKMLYRAKHMEENNYGMAREIAAWKQKLVRGWESIELLGIIMPDSSKKPLSLGETFIAEVVLNLNELSGTDIGIEIIFGQKINDEVKRITYKQEMEMAWTNGNKVTFRCDVPSNQTGVFDYAFRVFPKNPMLPHRQDFNLIKWL